MKLFYHLIGLDSIEDTLKLQAHDIRALTNQIVDLHQTIDKLHTNLDISHRAIGRIIAKLDPMYATSEYDPARRAESDRIGDEVIKKLKGEYLASNPMRWPR